MTYQTIQAQVAFDRSTERFCSGETTSLETQIFRINLGIENAIAVGDFTIVQDLEHGFTEFSALYEHFHSFRYIVTFLGQRAIHLRWPSCRLESENKK